MCKFISKSKEFLPFSPNAKITPFINILLYNKKSKLKIYGQQIISISSQFLFSMSMDFLNCAVHSSTVKQIEKTTLKSTLLKDCEELALLEINS